MYAPIRRKGETIEELEENIRDAYYLMMEAEEQPSRSGVQAKELEIEV